MHTFHLLFAAALLATTTVCAQSAPAPGVPFRPVGTVTASGASNLDDLQDKLAEKARQEGAKGFVVNSAGGDNHMYGTATIYK